MNALGLNTLGRDKAGRDKAGRYTAWRLACASSVFLLAACTAGGEQADDPSDSSSGSVAAMAGQMAPYAPGGLPELADRAASEAIPASFALGRTATDADIAPLDIHIMPDGRGLPAGSGRASDGEAIFAGKCAPCHGVQGEGTPLGAAVISSDAEVGFRRRVVGHYWPHATTAFDYIRRAMPWDSPGTLTNDEVYAVVAFLLAQSGVIAEDAVLDAGALRAIEMPALDRFVVDDRPTTNQVR